MNPRFLKLYNEELQHIREMGGEFAKDYPKIAGRLGLDTFECADPYVERLIEGFAFLAARVRLKVDAEFPRFTNAMLDMLYPHYLAPTPSMAVVKLQPDFGNNILASGHKVARDTPLRSLLGKGEQTSCEYRTKQDVMLWPIEIAEAEYLPSTGAVAAIGVTGDLANVRAAIRLRLRATAGLTFDKIALQSLPIFLRGADITPMKLYEALVAQSTSIVVRPGVRPIPWSERLSSRSIRQLGFGPNEAVLPSVRQSFQGYRLLHEYFTLPQRFQMLELTGLGPSVRRCTSNDLDIIVLLKSAIPELDKAVSKENFDLYCTPAINLFERRLARVDLNDKTDEYHIVPDPTAPMDYEVFQVTSVAGMGAPDRAEQEFLPFFTATDFSVDAAKEAYFAVYREGRVLSNRQRRRGTRSSYIGSETYISIVDGYEAPYRSDLTQLSIKALCTNRDLPLELPIGKGETDFTLQIGAPITSVRCVAGPTKPRPSLAEGETAWELISHLSLNYLSLSDAEAGQGAVGLRGLLSLYTDNAEPGIRRQIDGVRSVTTKSVVRRIPTADLDEAGSGNPADRKRNALGPITYGRGIEITVTCEESAFEGAGVFVLGAVLDRFFSKYVSINSFTETIIRTVDRGEVMRWPPRPGRRHLI